MSTETDDLSYYEHDLPKIIAGVRRGEKWEWKSGDTWISGDDLPNFLRHQSVRVRLAPVPVVKPWDCPADVPGPICWLRLKGDEGTAWLIVGIDEDGVALSQNANRKWSEVQKRGHEHSTDRIHWHPCVKSEGGK